MKIHYSFDNLNGIRNPVVTTGTFDGVHVGHQVIIRRLNKLAADVEGESVLITFHPHPRRVLYPDGKGKDLLLICAQDEKIRLLEQTGLDHLVIIEFTLDFAGISSKQFVEDILVGKLNAKVVVVGFNHHFGHNREGDFNYLYKLGIQHKFEVEEIPEQDIQNESVSSTKIRKALLGGNIQRANAYLDHYYILSGRVTANKQLSDESAYPVFKLILPEDVKLIPPDGTYAIKIADGDNLEKGVLYVKNWKILNNLINPEIEILFSCLNSDYSPGEKVLVYFHKSLRAGNLNGNRISPESLLQKDFKEIDELIF